MAKNLSKDQKVLAVILLLQLFMAVGFYFYFGGIATAGDQGRYLKGADNILNGHPLEERQASYLSYVLILALFKGLGLSLIWVIVFQWILSGVALVTLFKLSSRMSTYPANLLAPLFFLFADIQRWNQNILTDSFYISCAIILVYLILKTNEQPFSWAGILLTILFGTFTVFLRPNGWSFIPILTLALVVLPNISKVKKAGLILFFTSFIFLLVRFVSTHSEGQDMYLGWATAGEVIWNYPKGRISMPLAKADLQGTIGLFQYISTFPFSYLKLFFIRIIVELSHYRSVYSFLHNTVSVLFLLVSYSTAFIGLISYRKIFFARLVMLACFFHIGIIGITFADWDGRFLMHFFPLLLPFVSAGFSNIMRSMLFKRNYSL